MAEPHPWCLHRLAELGVPIEIGWLISTQKVVGHLLEERSWESYTMLPHGTPLSRMELDRIQKG